MTTRPRIAIAGFHHETNTFAPFGASYEDFVRADGYPAMTKGAAILDVFPPLGLPISGFIGAARATYDLVPLVWAAAEPCNVVADEAYERIAEAICQGIAGAGELDAIYLDLHGAMVVESFEDGEGELLRRVRTLVGLELPVIISLDMHANVTDAMVELSDGMTIYRTYPHIDMVETGQRAFDLLKQRIGHRKPLFKAMRKPPFLIPLAAQCTDFEPCKSLFSGLPNGVESSVFSVDIALGFPPSDIRECGPAVIAYGANYAAVTAAADAQFQRFLAAEIHFEMPMLGASEAVSRAISSGRKGELIVLADVQDNPGAGATSDTIGLLKAMVEGGMRDSALGLLWDPEAAKAAHNAGLGAEIDVRLGGRYGYDAGPFCVKVRVEALSDGVFTCRDPFNGDVPVDVGPMARLRILDANSDVQVAVASTRFQCLYQDLLRAVAIEPKEQSVVALKSTIHFRSDFGPIAKEIIMVESPGANICRNETVTYRNLRPGVCRTPSGLSAS
ncbi:microcystinase C [Mesorhizobium tianshanense]|nr:microcystinase C [Mesorhizobium tianshanense]